MPKVDIGQNEMYDASHLVFIIYRYKKLAENIPASNAIRYIKLKPNMIFRFFDIYKVNTTQ